MFTRHTLALALILGDHTFLTIWSRSGCHGQWSKILTMTMAKISASNHGQIVKISTKTTVKIQIFHGHNGQPKVLPRNLTQKTMAMNETQNFYGKNGKGGGPSPLMSINV